MTCTSSAEDHHGGDEGAAVVKDIVDDHCTGMGTNAVALSEPQLVLVTPSRLQCFHSRSISSVIKKRSKRSEKKRSEKKEKRSHLLDTAHGHQES